MAFYFLCLYLPLLKAADIRQWIFLDVILQFKFSQVFKNSISDLFAFSFSLKTNLMLQMKNCKTPESQEVAHDRIITDSQARWFGEAPLN